MPQYQIVVPGQGTFRVDSPTELTDLQAWQAVQNQLSQAAPAKKEGLGAAFGKGLESLLGSSRTAVGAFTGSPEEAALAGLKRQEQSPYADQVSLEKVSEAAKRGLLPAAGEVARQVPLAIAEQAPNVLATLGSAKAGSLLGAKLGTAVAPGVGTVVGGIGGGIFGAIAPSLLQQFGGNIQRQAQEQQAQGKPIDISRTSAGLAAVPQAGLDVAASLIPLGRTFAGKVLGPQVEELLKRGSVEGAERLARESLPTVLGKGAAISIATEVPTEVIQTMLERSQAGLALTTPDALAEYGNVAYQAGLLAPIGAVGRVGERSVARNEALLPGQRRGESDMDFANRLSQEISNDRAYAAALQAQPEAPPAGPPSVMELADIASKPQGYENLETIKQQILQAGTQKENQETLAAIKDFQNGIVVGEIQRRQPSISPVMDDKTLRSLGFVPGGEKSVYNQLINQDTGSDEVRVFLTDYAQKKAKPQTKQRIEKFLAQVERSQIPLAQGATDAGAAITEPSGAGVQVAVQPGAGAPTEGLRTTEPAGVVPPVEDVKPPAGGAEAAPPAITPVEPVKPVETPKTETEAKEQHAVQGLPIIEAPLDQLTLSKDVPQFKSDADEKGVVEKLGGKFDRTGVAPIQVWRRTDGRMEVISGRHRLDLAQRSGEATIPAQIHDEAQGFDAKRAAMLDAELNIRDQQGKVKDYVNYFENAGISQADADARGLLARPPGRQGFAIATQGSPDLIASHRANVVNDAEAFGIASAAPGDARLQALGIKAVSDGKNVNGAVNMMKAVKALAAERGVTEDAGDLFGFDDSAMREAEEMAKIASRKQSEVANRLSAISGASKRPEVAKKEGIDIKDPEALKRREKELRQQKASWDNWSSSPELIQEIKAEMVKPSLADIPATRWGEIERRAKAAQAAPAKAEAAPEKAELTPEQQALNKEIEAKIDQLEKVLKKIMNKFGLKDVALKLIDNMRNEGEYAQSVVRLALDAVNPVQALRHESIHALKELGFFSPQQWAVLEKQAKSKWIDQYLKTKNINKEDLEEGQKSRYDAYMELYKGDMDAIIEEAIADAFGDFNVNKAPPGLMQAILTRLRNFFDAVKTAFGGEVTAEQVFRKVEKGALKAETKAEAAPAKQSLREVPLSTRGLMEVQPIVAMQELGLKTDAVRKPGGIELFNDVRSIALALNQDTIRNKGKIAKTDTSLTSEKELAKAMVDEIGYQLKATAGTGTGKGWYSDNYPKAVKKLGKLFPELETDPYARTVFSALVAITSNGEKVSLNVKNAIKLYEDIRMGKDPRNIGSRRKTALDNNIAVVLQLMKQYGPTGMSNELLREITVKDMNAILRSRGEKPDTSYLADTKVPAAALYFGPKLGAFFSNLEGAEGYLTMDMWWTRTVNRMRGQLESKATEASIKKFAAMMDKPNATRDEVVAATIPLRNKYEEFGWHTELEELVGRKEPAEDKDKPAWTARAKRQAGPAYEALLFEHRLEKMANTIYKNEYELLEEAPFTSTDREFMYRTARRTQSLLKAEGINLSLADIQAALWYYEKRLYQHLSGRKADDIGYDEAITQLAGESTRPAGPSVVFAGQPVSGAGATGAGAAVAGVSAQPAQLKPSLREKASWDDKRIERLIDQYGYTDGRTYGIAAYVNPEEFVRATTPSKEFADELKAEAGALDRDQIAKETQTPFLEWDIEKGVIVGHEGRHRMSALSAEGVESAPVVLYVKDRYGSKKPDQYERQDSVSIKGQKFQDGVGRPLTATNLIPLEYRQTKSLREEFGAEAGVKYSLRVNIPASARARVVATTVTRQEKGFVERLMEAISPTSYSDFRAQALNRYNQLGVYDKIRAKKMGGAALLADSSAESAALLSDLGAGLTASALGVHDRMGGIPVFRNGITIISNQNGTIKGPTAIFAPLAADPAHYQDYQFWAGVKRGSRYMQNPQGKYEEKLFTPSDVKEAEVIRKAYLKAGIDFEAMQKEWIKYNDGLVQYMVDTGVLSQERADLYRKHADYLPFYRQMDGRETIGPKVFQAISGVKPPKAAKGGEALLDDFLENIVRNTQSAIQAGVKNVAAQRAAKVAMDIGMASRLNFKSSAPGTFDVLENGQVVTYQSKDELFINAIKSLGIPDLPFIGLLSGPANLLRNLVTKDPGFMLANLMRDSMSAWVTSGVKMTPMVNTFTNFGSAIAGKDPVFQALMNAGILGGYEFSQNVEQSGREFGKALRKQAKIKSTGLKGVAEMGAKPFTSLWDALEKGSTASDAATRMEVYKRTLAETGNEAEALFRALEVMNFNRKGSSAVVRILTAAVPFLNARMQGLDVLYRAASGQMNARDAAQIQKQFFVRGAMIASLSAAYWLLTHDDEEYKKQEQETRDNYWLLPSLGVKIPIPFEIGVLFKVIPERILGYTFGSDTGEDFLKSMARQLTSTLAFNPIPQAVMPVVETMTNFSFFTMRPIVGQGMEGLQPAYQVGPGTSRLAEGLGEMTKGMAKELQVSPMKIDQLISGYTGTMGMYLMNLMDAVYDMNTDSPKPARRFEQMPLIRRFAIDPEARGNVTAYYELKNSVDSIVRTSNMLERTMNYEELPGYLMDNMRMLASKDYILDLEKTMKEFREMKILIRSASMDANAKKDAILAIDQMENQLTSNIQYMKKLAKGD